MVKILEIYDNLYYIISLLAPQDGGSKLRSAREWMQMGGLFLNST